MSGNPFGVVIPPDKGDANWGGTVTPHADGCGMWRADAPSGHFALFHTRQAAEAWLDDGPEAPTTPHAPSSAPNTPPPGNDAQDGSDALRAALVEWFESHLTFDAADALLPRVLAYGEQRAAEAHHDARNDARDNGNPDVAAWLDGYIQAVEHPHTCPECTQEQAPASKHVHAWTQDGYALSCACGGTARADRLRSNP